MNRNNIGKNEKVDLDTDSHGVWTRWRKYLSQPLNVHGVNEGRQTENRTEEQLGPEPSAFEMNINRRAKATQITRY